MRLKKIDQSSLRLLGLNRLHPLVMTAIRERGVEAGLDDKAISALSLSAEFHLESIDSFHRRMRAKNNPRDGGSAAEADRSATDLADALAKHFVQAFVAILNSDVRSDWAVGENNVMRELRQKYTLERTLSGSQGIFSDSMLMLAIPMYFQSLLDSEAKASEPNFDLRLTRLNTVWWHQRMVATATGDIYRLGVLAELEYIEKSERETRYQIPANRKVLDAEPVVYLNPDQPISLQLLGACFGIPDLLVSQLTKIADTSLICPLDLLTIARMTQSVCDPSEKALSAEGIVAACKSYAHFGVNIYDQIFNILRAGLDKDAKRIDIAHLASSVPVSQQAEFSSFEEAYRSTMVSNAVLVGADADTKPSTRRASRPGI